MVDSYGLERPTRTKIFLTSFHGQERDPEIQSRSNPRVCNHTTRYIVPTAFAIGVLKISVLGYKGHHWHYTSITNC